MKKILTILNWTIGIGLLIFLFLFNMGIHRTLSYPTGENIFFENALIAFLIFNYSLMGVNVYSLFKKKLLLNVCILFLYVAILIIKLLIIDLN